MATLDDEKTEHNKTSTDILSAKKKTVLIVDDNKINRQILHKILSDEYEVLEAENGQIALDILYKESAVISAVLLDLVMPVMNGYEVLGKMQKDATLSKLPVIVTTGSDSQQAEIEALSLGAHDFLIKPYKPAIIKHRLANTIRLRETAAIANIAEKDSLTGVYNKDFFCKKCEEILQTTSDKFDLVCCDIERFKLINDLFGTNTGDNLLKHMADILLENVKGRGICGRIGGDQFACLVKHKDNYYDEDFERISVDLNTFQISIGLNVSYGIYTIDDVTIPVNAMCDRALLACNSIKGKYDVFYAYYDKSFRQNLLTEQIILDSMNEAIAQRQFLVYYQPKYDITTEKVGGAEALVRWIHPTHGFMNPGEFIPLFEKNGFITTLDTYVWDTVCSNLHDWIAAGESIVPVSMNVSRADIYNPQLCNILTGLIKKYNIPPEYVHLEITETAYTENPQQLIEVVNRLKNSGFIIEMDDFGSGYSSLNMLSELPIDILKLDMKFIQSETKKNSSKSILSFVISLARWMNLLVIAEGVETREQLEILRKMNCNYVQGYYYSKPLPRADFEQHLKDNPVATLDETPKFETVGDDQVIITQRNSGKTMMIIDDIELNRAILSEIFSPIYTIVETANGESAYNYIKNNYKNIDIILLDLVMPVMDGFQLLGKLKKDDKFKNIPVIVTSQAGENGEARALEMGAADFISKPYNTEVALRRVHNVMADDRINKLVNEKELYKRMQEMELRATTDSLTGLINRSEFEIQVSNYFHLQPTGEGTFIILDVDNFKTINDSIGHKRSDDVIEKIGEVLKSTFTKDDMVSRLGGDEFAIFLTYAYNSIELSQQLASLCKKLRFAIDSVSVSCSIGACFAPEFGADFSTLYRNADIALLNAKHLGKNQFQIYGGQPDLPAHVLLKNVDWLMDEASDAIIVCNADNYKILYLNDVACKLAGKPKNECMHKECYKVFWNSDSPCTFCTRKEDMTNEYSESTITPDGSDSTYSIKAKLVEWGGQEARIQYIQGKKNVTAASSQILAHIPTGVLKYSADTSKFDFVNESMPSMLGYTKEEFTNKFNNSFENMVLPEDCKRVMDEIHSQCNGDNICQCEYRIEKADGSLCNVHDICRLVTDSDGKKWYYSNIVDISKSK